MSLKKWLPLIVIASLVILLDQVTKLWIINNVLVGQTIPLLEPILKITRTTNTGFAFGLASGGSFAILILSSFVTILILWMYYKSSDNERLQRIAFAMIIGGAIGNIIDRIRLGHVVDFVHIDIPNLISNVSNFADHFVVLGVIVLLIDSFINPPEKEEDDDESEVEPIPEI
ncbi:MAG: signal peptidase II [Phototrophicaceae bacterium]